MIDISFTPIVMITLSLIASIYLFNGAFFKYSIHITIFFSSLFLLVISYISIMNRIFTYSYSFYIQECNKFSFLISIIAMILAIGMMIVMIKWLPFAPKYFNIFMCSLLSSMIITDIIPLEDNLLLSTSILIALFIVILFLYKIKKEVLLITTSSIFGAFLLSYLFSSFYYFSPPVQGILFVVLLLGGALTQRHTLISRTKKENQDD